MPDRVDRFFESVSAPPWALGAGVTLAGTLLYLAASVWTGSLAELSGRGLGDLLDASRDHRLRDARLAVVLPLLVGTLLAARRYAILGARSNLDCLRALLREDPAASAALVEAGAPIDVRRARRGAWLSLLLFPLMLLSIDRDPGLYFRSSYWTPEHALNCVFGLAAFWNAAWLTSCLLHHAGYFSALARSIERIDLLDRRPLAPFARQSLRSALLAVLPVAILALNAADRGFAWSLAILGPISLATSGTALLLPARGARDRVRRAKQQELERVRAAIHGDPDALADSVISKRAPSLALADLLAYRNHVEGVHEWPFDAPTLARFALFALLPLGSWLGGAFVERGLGALLD